MEKVNSIQILPKNLISKIAAGEVIERPASIVKELVENSIDAGADDITIEIEEYGLNKIRVTDNGSGIAEADIKSAFIQHSTSKIKDLDDLNNIYTLGFRGEGLASILAVADIFIHTYNQNSQPVEAQFINGEFVKTGIKPRPQGTMIDVLDVFRHVPARKKFLSSGNTELKHISETIKNIAIPYNNTKFSFLHNNKEIFSVPSQSREKRIESLTNAQFKNKLVKISYQDKDIKISGFVGHPSTATTRGAYQYTFLNNRPIEEKTVYASTKQAFETAIPNNKKPSYFIFIELDPKEVDVNVHPRKKEVRFNDKSKLFQAIKLAIKENLEKEAQRSFKNSFGIKDESKIKQSNVSQDSNIYQKPKTTPSKSTSKKDYFGGNDLEKSKSHNTKPHKALIKQSMNFTKTLLQSENNRRISQQTIIDNKNTFNGIYIGQIFMTYLIYEDNDKLLILDQHAADERVKFEYYEKLLKTSKPDSQTMITPFIFEERDTDKVSIMDNVKILQKFGFEVNKMSGNSIQITAIPNIFNQKDIKKFVNDLLAEIDEDTSTIKQSQIETKIIATVACHSSIRAGDRVHEPQAVKLIDDLLGSRLPYSCPHGRPIMWELPKMDISKKFDRNK